jgi:hypothetical protein
MRDAEDNLRKSTYSGRPAGAESFLSLAESALNRKLSPAKSGRPPKARASSLPPTLFNTAP